MEKAVKKYWPIFLLPTMAAFLIGFIIPSYDGCLVATPSARAAPALFKPSAASADHVRPSATLPAGERVNRASSAARHCPREPAVEARLPWPSTARPEPSVSFPESQ